MATGEKLYNTTYQTRKVIHDAYITMPSVPCTPLEVALCRIFTTVPFFTPTFATCNPSKPLGHYGGERTLEKKSEMTSQNLAMHATAMMSSYGWSFQIGKETANAVEEHSGKARTLPVLNDMRHGGERGDQTYEISAQRGPAVRYKLY